MKKKKTDDEKGKKKNLGWDNKNYQYVAGEIESLRAMLGKKQKKDIKTDNNEK